jgi:FkbM family methyltransferase
MKRMGLLNRVYIKKLHNGALMKVNPSEHIQQQLFWYGYYEKDVILAWESFTQKDFTVLDIGANAGYYSLIASKKVHQVYAFEPSPLMRLQLEQNIALNGNQNISVEPYAASDQSGAATLYLSANDNSGMTGMQPAENFSGTTELVKAITIDEWHITKGSPKIHMIKIDVEGAEMKVLEGMKGLLKRDQPGIFIEVVPELLRKYGHTTEGLFKFLGDLGYDPYEFPGNKNIVPLPAGKQPVSEMLYFAIGNRQ